MSRTRSRLWRARAAAAVLAASAPTPLHAETVYEFVMTCRRVDLSTCFNRISDGLDRVKVKDDGTAFCLPRAWAGPGFITSTYPISLLEYVRVGLSASRFGKADEPVEGALRDILKDIYPCD